MEEQAAELCHQLSQYPVRSITGLDAGLVLKSKTLGRFFNFLR
jgi:hypothetical protein